MVKLRNLEGVHAEARHWSGFWFAVLLDNFYVIDYSVCKNWICHLLCVLVISMSQTTVFAKTGFVT